jgi:predicted secreted protein
LQFQGSGPLETVGSSEATDVIAIGSYTKGQFVRLFLGIDNTVAPSTVIAAAKTLSLHVSLTLEDATTKDTAGDWTIQEPTALSYDISTGALVRSGETITSQVGAKSLADIETIYEAGTPVKWKISNVSGDNNRTASSTIVSGSVVLTQLTINGPNRQNADYTAQLNGYGDYTVAA